MIKSLKRNSGFSTVEMLCAVIMLILMSSLFAVGVRFASEVYGRSVSTSEAQTLCNTLELSISDELRYSGSVNESAINIGFFSQRYGKEALNGFSSRDGQIFLGEHPLLSPKAYPKGVNAELSLAYREHTRNDKGIKGIFTAELKVYNSTGTLIAEKSFEVMQLNYHPATAVTE